MNNRTIKCTFSLVFATFLVFTISCDNERSSTIPDASDDPSGITFSGVSGVYPDYELDGNIVSYDEILGYDSTECIFLLRDVAGDRIREKEYPVSPTWFVVALDGEKIYIAGFIPGYSSLSCADCIAVEPFSYNNRYRMTLGYPGGGYFSGTDPRNDARIISRLKADNKLINTGN